MSITAWQPSTDYALNDLVYLSTGDYWLKCTTAGTSDTVEPPAPTATGQTVADGTAQWLSIGQDVVPRTNNESKLGDTIKQWAIGYLRKVACSIIALVNTTDDTTTPVDIKNYGQQGTGSDLTAFVIHNYTDGFAAQYDYVGNNAIMKLVNAYNDSARPGFGTGTGNFIQCHTYNGSMNEVNFTVTSDHDIHWQKANATPSMIINNNADLWGFTLKMENYTKFPFTIAMDDKSIMNIRTDSKTNPRSVLFESDADMDLGVTFQSQAGPLKFYSKQGIMTFWDSSDGYTEIMNLQEAFAKLSGTLQMENMPTTDPGVAGRIYADSTDGYRLRQSQG